MGKTYRIGEKIGNFEVIQSRYIKDYSSNGVLLRHSSGMEVFFLDNEDDECFFSYSVYTPPANSTGVFHILEHTLLTGSKRYPVRDPFMMMVRNSANTFLNALTGPDRTYFPAASPVKKDFDNIFSVYTDAVFSPLLRKESFEQEGIRLSSKPSLHFEGVVFSEMQGDISSHEAVVAELSTRPLFDSDSPYRYEFGGNPPDITDLSYEEFIQTYKEHYVPANITLFFYGNLDLEEKLDYLEKNYLSKTDGGKRVERAKLTHRWDKPKRVYGKSNAEEGGESSSLMVSWLLGEADSPLDTLILSLIVDILLGNPGSPLYKAVVESNIGRDLSSESGMSDSYRELIFSVGVSGSRKERADEFEAFILSALRDIATTAIGEKMVEAALRRMEFRLREKPSGMSMGYALYFGSIERTWAFGKDPLAALDVSEYLMIIREHLKENKRFFEDWITTNLVDNPHRLLSVITMDKDHQKRIEREIEDKLKIHAHSWSKKEEDEFDRFSHTPDSIEDLKRLPRLTYKDVPNVSGDININERDSILYTTLTTGSIIYLDLAIEVTDLSIEELEDLSLLSRLLLMTGTDDMDLSAFQTELSFSTGGTSANIDGETDTNGNARVFLFVRTKALKEYYRDAAKLINKLLINTVVSDKERIKSALEDISSDYQSSVLRNAYQYVISSSSQSISKADYIGERTRGIEFWLRAEEMKNELDSLSERLPLLRDKIVDRKRMRVHIGVEKDDLEYALEISKEFYLSIPEKEGVGIDTKPFEPKKETLLFSISSPVTFMGLTAKSPSHHDSDYASLSMLLRLVGKNELWSLIREKGGAYGAGTLPDYLNYAFSFYTYRDPRFDASYQDIFKAIEEEKITDEKIEDVKLLILSKDVRPLGPQTASYTAFMRFLYSLKDEERHEIKERYLSVDKESLERVRGRLLTLMKGASLTAIADSKTLDSSHFEGKKRKLPIK